ncbi:spore germination protein [Paenibacillus guangzhouensis]|uniref:spore germination protein n=1 Tax=Paenibacillus guangzhouensis TaxID=1473112 RepID=UPI001266CB8F|nr:spore germination protein [Paenibacillus guangzhouensis]
MGFLEGKNQTEGMEEQSVQEEGSSMAVHLNAKLRINLELIRESLGNSNDIVIRQFQIGSGLDVAIIFMDGLADAASINNFIIESMMLDYPKEGFAGTNPLTLLKSRVLTVGDLKEVTDYETLMNFLLSGDAILLLNGYTKGLVICVKGWEHRSVTEATTETIIRGSKEGFIENIRTNTAMIRRRIKSHNLWLENMQIGKVTKTNVSIMYIKGIANDKAVMEVRERLNRIQIDGILESGYIEQMIQDNSATPFPTMFNTERPDVVAADLLEGRIAILIDGTPFVLIVPAVFIQFFQAAEDYYHRIDFSSLLRILRMISFFIALAGPSLYIAITTFHQEMLPTDLLVNLVAQREGVPFPAFIEAIVMEVTFEILREAGVRMPRAIGSAVSIVGTLVVGTAAVDAGMVSAAMVIVVSITAISNFVFPSTDMAISIRILRFPLMMLAATFGLLGIVAGIIALLLHLCSLRSFGIPYMSPFSPLVPSDLKDTLIRFPQWAMFTRPRLTSEKNIVRERTPEPKPPKPGEK